MVKILHIWSFDPGKMSGWCHLSVHNEAETGIFNCGEADHFQIGNMLYDNPALKSAVTNPAIETVFVCESYQVTPGKTSGYWSLETIGLIRYFAGYYQVPLHLYKSSDHKPLIKDNIIKKAGLWEPSKNGHQMDATRLCLYYLTTQRKVLTECLRP